MNRIKISLLLLIFPFILGQASAQEHLFEITIHSRVDTTKNEVKEIVELWTNYLKSQPDSLYDNPYWNNEEKVKFKDFDLSRKFIYQFPSGQLLNYFKPTILSIEKEGENYSIRTMFSAEGLEGIYRRSTPWCFTKLFAIKENNEWKLKNALPIVTENWNRKTIGKITFIYPMQHKFDNALAKKANDFCNRIVKEFEFPEFQPFDFYITKDGDALGQLLNFDFFFAGYTTGIGMNENRMLFSGMGSEYYPHEFIHLIVPKFERNGLIEEGFATWKGGTMEKTFEESAVILANQIALNDTVTFTDILNKKWGWQYAAYYTSGAILCKSAFDKGGISAVKKLLEAPNNNVKLIKIICEIFDIKKEEIDKFWRTETMKFKV